MKTRSFTFTRKQQTSRITEVSRNKSKNIPHHLNKTNINNITFRDTQYFNKSGIKTRPRRCNICKKMICSQSYVLHRQNCKSFRIKKINNLQEKYIKQQIQQIIQRKINYDQKIPQDTYFQTQKQQITRNTQQFYYPQSQNEISENRSIQNIQHRQSIRQLMNQIQQLNYSEFVQNQNNQQYSLNNQTYLNQNLIISDISQQPLQLVQSNVTISHSQSPQDSHHEIDNNPNNYIRSLVINTSQIQGLINRSFLRENETIQVMIEQLTHLNTIVDQVNEISVLSNHSQIGQVFANRIRQLQSSLINQIGEAIIRNIQTNLSIFSLNFVFQLQVISQSQGFTEEQIEQKFLPSMNNDSSNSCYICLVDLIETEKIISLNCNHHFHPSCIIEWLIKKTTCPVCRKDQK